MPGTVGETHTGENDEQKLQQQEAFEEGIFPAPVETDVLMDEAQKQVEQEEQLAVCKNIQPILVPDSCEKDKEDTVLPIPSHAEAQNATNTLILYATGNGDTEVTDSNLDIFAYLETVSARKKLSMIQPTITDFSTHKNK